MDKKVLFSTLVAGMLTLSAHALSLDEARQMAHDNYPAIRQYELIERSREFTLDNVKKGWLPKVSASAGAYAFTDILKQGGQMEQMGVSLPNWLCSGSVTLSQNIYDGGQISAQRQVAEAQSDVQRQQLDVTMYAVRERIDQLYFGILLIDEQMAQNDLLQNDLATSEKTVRSMMKGGIANQSDLDAILVEELKADQQKEALKASRKAYLRMLGVFVGKDLGEEERLEKPTSLAGKGEWGVNRPELQYYASQNLLLDAQRRQLDAKLRPTVSLFGMGMVHSKMSDLLTGGLLMGGVSVAWNIGALYTRRNDIRKLEVQRAINDSQRATFLFNNRLQNEEADGNAASLRRQIAQDEEIVRLRESIRSKGDRKVQLGTESVNELVRDINAVSMARAQKALHEIELLREIYKQKTINNE